MINRATAEHYEWGHGCEGWHLLKHTELGVIEERIPPHTSEVRHYHQRSRQFFFVLAGIVTIETGNIIETLRQFDGIEIPPCTPHRIYNDSDEDVRFLVVSQPHAHGDRITVDPD